MSEDKFECFAVVELFGHAQCAGKVTEQVVGGETFVRVDVPLAGNPHSRLFGKGAIYAMNLTTEAIATRYAQRIKPPLQLFVEQEQREADWERQRAAAALSHDRSDAPPELPHHEGVAGDDEDEDRGFENEGGDEDEDPRDE
jgi:hypothetical protein